jgi:hypothetical protein
MPANQSRPSAPYGASPATLLGACSAQPAHERAPEVIPETDATAPTLQIEASGQPPTGIEGATYFVRVVSPTGTVVLEREWQWPSFEQNVRPGTYKVTAYSRTCSGNCAFLGPAMLSCTVDILAEPSMTYTLTYHATGDGGVTCDAAPLGS